ncbi:META domain-containing protein [Mangrovimonas sp. TPBH4]|uniref:META domain-containing protein n=1 Tax=Mangrovimonas sp. TPBH4 TaxID=1645914 RepID=UPI0009E8110B|nr:META domain-containing protein [Mangrovimonas sp. TPBH4]
MRTKALFLFTCILMLTACKSSKQTTSSNNNTTPISLTDTPWRLVELQGQKITDMTPQPYLYLDSKTNRAGGNSGCNGFGGSYTLENDYKIKLSGLISTMKACPDMSTEKAFLKVLESVDNYTIVNGVLSLNKAKMATMAKFEVDQSVMD